MITLSGDNYYLINAELTKLKAGLGELGLTTISGREANLEDLKLDLSSYSLFNDKRLVVLDEPSKIKGFDEYVSQIDEAIPETTKVVIVEPSLDKRKSYYKYLNANTDFKNFTKLNMPILTKWAVEYALENGGKLSSSDANYLVDRVGDDQLLLAQEIDKLILYSKVIDRQTINLLSEQSASSTIFEMLDAAFSLNIKKALAMYAEQRLQKVEPEQILAMLSWQLNSLAVYMTSKNLPSSEVTSKSGLSPYTLSKARQIATKISFSHLKSLVSDLANMDQRYKSASFNLDEGLKNFIVGLSY